MNPSADGTVRLGRQVRFSLPVDDLDAAISGGVTNSFAGWPRPSGLAPYYSLTLEIAGHADPASGYLMNIKRIDEIVRARLIPLIADRVRQNDREPGQWLASAWPMLESEIRTACGGRLGSATLGWTPQHHISYRGEGKMVYLTEQFEFAAAHRLWSPQLSEQDNRDTFGKCANPNGHGHNYLLEVTVGGEPGAMPLGRFERTVRSTVVDAFDHKHLNLDCPEFASLNPTVENIARVIFDKLADESAMGSRLACVRLYETAKTYAECRR
ncbi:MAG: hypothetical protein BIFFINMI_00161 [Phycisphaerae bacterium]|nr:hypothetical protein [Phycisphaerae bacterium]